MDRPLCAMTAPGVLARLRVAVRTSRFMAIPPTQRASFNKFNAAMLMLNTPVRIDGSGIG
jgi:hypothetical protein